MISEPRILPAQIAAAAVTAFTANLCVYVVYDGDPLDIREACAHSSGAVGQRLGTLSVAFLCAVVAHFRMRGWLRASLAVGVWFFYLSLLDPYIYRGYWFGSLIAEWLVCVLNGFAVASLAALPFVILRHDPRPWKAP